MGQTLDPSQQPPLDLAFEAGLLGILGLVVIQLFKRLRASECYLRTTSRHTRRPPDLV